RGLPAPQAPTGQDTAPPLTPTEACLAAIWSELLGDRDAGDRDAGDRDGGPGDGGHRDFGADDSFFASGGHSLLVLRLRCLVGERLGVELPLWEYLAHPTLAGLSARLDAAVGGDAAARDRAAVRDREVSTTWCRTELD